VLLWGVGRRPLLVLTADGLRVALPDFYRTLCAEFAARAGVGDAGVSGEER